MQPTLRNYTQDLRRGVLTLQASITAPANAVDQEDSFLILCNLFFIRAGARYGATVEALTKNHDDLKEPKPPIELEAAFQWGTITGSLKLGAHLCADGKDILRNQFAEQIPADIDSELEDLMAAYKLQRQLEHVSPFGVIVVRDGRI